MALLYLITLLFLFILGMPVAFSMGLSAVIMLILETGGLDIDTSIIAQRMFSGTNSFIMLAIPFFLLAGKLMNKSSITDKMFKFASCLVGHWNGGMGQINIVASVIFAGMTGTACSDAAGLGQIELKTMRNAGYDDDFSIAVTGASATIGPIIPPSLPLVVYGIISGASVGKLLLGGLLPGIVLALILMIMVSLYVKNKNYPRKKRASFKEIRDSFINGLLPLMTPVIIVGGIMFGIFTPTEAAAAAAFYALILGFFVYRELTLKDLWEIFSETAKESATVIFIVSTATLYGWMLTRARIPIIALNFLETLTDNRYVILFLLNVFLLIIGCFMETIASLSILVPVLMPIISNYGIDPVHFGLIMVFNLVLGLLTPPFGEILFILNKISGVPLERIIRSLLPFFVPLFITLLLITYFPPLVTWLPSLVFNR